METYPEIIKKQLRDNRQDLAHLECFKEVIPRINSFIERNEERIDLLCANAPSYQGDTLTIQLVLGKKDMIKEALFLFEDLEEMLEVSDFKFDHTLKENTQDTFFFVNEKQTFKQWTNTELQNPFIRVVLNRSNKCERIVLSTKLVVQDEVEWRCSEASAKTSEAFVKEILKDG